MNNNRQQSELVKHYVDLFDIVLRYWKAFGRGKELLCSPFLHAAVVITALSSGYWISSPWHATAISVLPNLLGFGLSGYAIWIGWGDEKLREMLMDIETSPDASAYVHVSSIFAHFGLIQILALVFALTESALDYELSQQSLLAHMLALVSAPSYTFAYLKPVGSAIGYFLFVYAILTALETTFALFRLTTWLQIQRRAIRAREAAEASSQVRR